ncbi:MAG: YraN family protein [Spirochaetaceae bacterium]|jgi:putative endonuclease|nr:YraN family protein [Spirochaetaceae bacterium]
MSQSRSADGRSGEDRAAAFLEAAGMHIIARNVRSPQGEIDIIAQDGAVLVFVEVKTWSTYSAENLQYSINKQKQYRIIETAKYFLDVNRAYDTMAIRFDLVFISPQSITHLESAFAEGLA